MSRFLPDRATLGAALSGLLLALAFPSSDLESLAWFALVPLFWVMERRPYRSGFVAGVVFFGVVLYWLNIAMITYGRMHPIFSFTVYLLLILYLSLFWGAATWAACRLKTKLNYPLPLTLPVLWTALEFLRSFLFTGFPWATLGYSQQNHLVLIQSADLFGVYGITFLLVLCNATLARLAVAFKDGKKHSFPRKTVACTLVLFLLNWGYGQKCLKGNLDARENTITVALAQGNIDQSLKWNPAYKTKTVDIYGTLSLSAAQTKGADLILWPESATPFYFQEESLLADQVRNTARETGAYLLFGSPAVEQVDGQQRYLNSAFLLSPSGESLGRSDKIHLVPFGEYVPLKTLFPFLDKLVTGIGDFSPGTVNPLPMAARQIGVLVCYEGIFPELARNYVRKGSDLLVNITNDAWFGRSSAPDQHLAMTRFRAIENRIWVARAANTGISAFITPSGRVQGKTAVFEEAVTLARVGLGAGNSLYTRFGDVFPGLFLVISILWLVRSRRD
jgi:apolipoprotein N-acyltransferase